MEFARGVFAVADHISVILSPADNSTMGTLRVLSSPHVRHPRAIAPAGIDN